MDKQEKIVHDVLIELEKVLEPIYDTVYDDMYFFAPQRYFWSYWCGDE